MNKTIKVLWTTNCLFPEIANALHKSNSVNGAWLWSMANAQKKYCPGIELCILSWADISTIEFNEINSIKYITLPNSFEPGEESINKILSFFDPDIIHLNGTERKEPLRIIRMFPQKKKVISIQGLQSVYSRYLKSGIGENELRHCFPLEFIMNRSVRLTQKAGKYELVYLSMVDNVIGRTSWDKAHVKALAPNAHFFKCNEVLRKGFFENEWDINKIERYTIFLSQGKSPVKGFHIALKAISFLIKDFPEVSLRIGGDFPTKSNHFLTRNYCDYIKWLIKSLHVENRVHFLGKLDTEGMIREYKKAHVFLIPSTIENSPNSLGEAQCIGTPVVASFVGGIPDMVKDNESGLLYPMEEYELLANKVSDIFKDDTLATYLSKNEISAARERHDPQKNALELMKIYEKVLNNDSIR